MTAPAPQPLIPRGDSPGSSSPLSSEPSLAVLRAGDRPTRCGPTGRQRSEEADAADSRRWAGAAVAAAAGASGTGMCSGGTGAGGAPRPPARPPPPRRAGPPGGLGRRRGRCRGSARGPRSRSRRSPAAPCARSCGLYRWGSTAGPPSRWGWRPPSRSRRGARRPAGPTAGAAGRRRRWRRARGCAGGSAGGCARAVLPGALGVFAAALRTVIVRRCPRWS